LKISATSSYPAEDLGEGVLESTSRSRFSRASGATDQLRADYPELEDEDIRQALAYAAAMLADETVEIPTVS
jgi:hypothetical protein